MIGCLRKIVSGGQTGADRGGLDAALAHGLEIGGWAPQGYKAEDGIIPERYRVHMRESVSPNYGLRTRLNVQDSDGTLLLSFADTLTGGSKFTVVHVKRQKKPCKHLVLPRGRGVVPVEVTLALWDWLEGARIAVLNIAGPRESKERGLQAAAERVIGDLLKAKASAATSAVLAFCDARDAANFKIGFSAEERADGEWEVVPPSPFSGIERSIEKPKPRVFDVPETLGVRHLIVDSAAVEAIEAAIVFKPGKPITPSLLEDFDIAKRCECGSYMLCCPPSCARDFVRKCCMRTDPDALRDLINRYRHDLDAYLEALGIPGGSFHLVFDDKNHDRSDVGYARASAIADGDIAGTALADALLALPDDVFVQVLPGPTYCGTCCQDYGKAGECKCSVEGDA